MANTAQSTLDVKTIILTGVIALVCLCIGGGTVGAFWLLTPPPEPVTVYSTPQIIEIPVEVPVEVVRTVEVERVITATPSPLVAEPLQNTDVVHTPDPVAAAPICIDGARIDWQPVSDIQASAKKIGTRRKLVWIIENTGECTWDGYKWESSADYLSLDVPYTLPGGKAVIEYQFPIQGDLSLRMFLVPPNPQLRLGLNASGLLGLSNANTVDSGAVYYLETYNPDVIGSAPLGGGCVGAG